MSRPAWESEATVRISPESEATVRISPFDQPRLGRVERISAVDQRCIGQILVDLGRLQPGDLDRVHDYHRRKGVRFGEAARRLKLVSEADIRQALSIQFDYPCLRPGEGRLAPDLVAAYAPDGAQAESLRDLRSELLVRWFDRERRALSVISPRPGDGRSYVVSNLGVLFAQWGGRTLIIDADLRNPQQHHIFDLAGQGGLSALLCGRAGIETAQAVPYFGNLSVLTAGPVPPNPQELLSRQAFARLLYDARQSYEIVLVDTPAGCIGSDARAIAAHTGGALLIARQDRSKLTELEELVERVAGRGTEIVGAALNEN